MPTKLSTIHDALDEKTAAAPPRWVCDLLRSHYSHGDVNTGLSYFPLTFYHVSTVHLSIWVAYKDAECQISKTIKDMLCKC